MTIFNVTYDLNKNGQNYSGLYKELESTDHLHFLDSNWLINTSETAEGLYNRLKKHLDNNDNIIVIKVTKPYYGWLPQSMWDWISLRII